MGVDEMGRRRSGVTPFVCVEFRSLEMLLTSGSVFVLNFRLNCCRHEKKT